MKALYALIGQFETREKELVEGLISSAPKTMEDVRYQLGQIHEVRRCRDELRTFFRMQDEEEL